MLHSACSETPWGPPRQRGSLRINCSPSPQLWSQSFCCRPAVPGSGACSCSWGSPAPALSALGEGTHASPLHRRHSPHLSPPCAARGAFALLGSGLSSGSSTAMSPWLPAPPALPALPGVWRRGFVVPCSVCTGCPSPLPQFTALEFQSNTHAKRTAINLIVSIKYCLF